MPEPTTTSPASMGGPLSEAERPRNQHCMNCGDTRGGPMGHETSECTYDSSIITAVRGALKPSHRLVLGRLVHDAQQDTYPLADADGSGGPYIVQGCVVNSAPQIQDAVRTIWKRVPTLLDELQAKRDEVKHLRTKAESLLTQNGVLVTEVRFQAERADGFREERDAATARVGVLEGQLATAREEAAADKAKLAALPDLETIRRIERERGNWGLRLGQIRAELSSHLSESTDPCMDHGNEYPCDVKQALDAAPEMPRPPAEPSIPMQYGPECEHKPEWRCSAHGECRACECGCFTYPPTPEGIREAAQEPVSGPETPGTGSGRGTGVAEAPGTAQESDDA